MAVSALKEGLLPISMVSTAFHNKLSFHEYEGPSLDLGERERILATLGDNQALMLRNHGILVTGKSVPDAFLRLYRLERACQGVGPAGRGHIGCDVADAAREGFEHGRLVQRGIGGGQDALAHPLGELRVGVRRGRDADQLECRRQQPVAMQRVERGPEHAAGEVAGRAEEDQRAAIVGR